jgi:hypothetical protein
MEIITDIIGILAFVLTVGQLIWGLWNKRTNIKLSIENLEQIRRESYTELILHTILIDKSRDTINITRIILIDSAGNEYPSLLEHKWIGEDYYPKFPETDIPITERKLSADFPIHLVGSGAKLVSIIFHVYKGFPLFKKD